MRIAVISDIHGNIWALEAVLAHIKARGVDVTVNLGDILSGPIEPAATADLLMSLDLPTIRGNHERHLLDCARRPGAPSDQYAFEHTSETHRTWLASLPATLAYSDQVFLCHGTPSNDLVYFLEQVNTGGARMAAGEHVEEHARGITQSLLLCGHSHMPRTHAVAGQRLVVNPGSVGLQAYYDNHPIYHVMQLGSPHARYAICEETRDGWNVEQHCVSYPHEKAAAAALQHGRADWAQWLATGRVG